MLSPECSQIQLYRIDNLLEQTALLQRNEPTRVRARPRSYAILSEERVWLQQEWLRLGCGSQL